MVTTKITPQKSRAIEGTNKGFWWAEVVRVFATDDDPYQVFIKIDRLGIGINDPVPADYIGSPPRVGDVLWCTFVENRHDDYLIFNTQHQAKDDMSMGVVRFGGQTEQYGTTIKIDPTEYPGSNRTSIRMDRTEIGTDALADGTEGDWYVWDAVNEAFHLRLTGSGDLAVTGDITSPTITDILTRLTALESDTHSH